ncbi:MAG: hypothetical protein JST81_01460 [Bacteroidetes bacterium]|jgi:hypothetical protein|nr:hypothetical protein [Bacteroidota bacterium]
MNTHQQVTAVKDIIRIKNRILHTSDWVEIADLLQKAIDLCAAVPPNSDLDPVDKTMSKGWNIISLKRLIKSIREGAYSDVEAAYPEIATSLLRLAMVFVKNGLDDVNKILSDSFLRKNLFSSDKLRSRSNRF